MHRIATRPIRSSRTGSGRPIRRLGAVAGFFTAAAMLAACSTPAADSAAVQSEEIEEAVEQTASAECAYPITVTDMAGNEVVIESADSVVVTDNRIFAMLNEWGVQPTAAPRTLVTTANSWKDDESILDTGSHGEPDMEAVVAADPDLIVSGYRYRDHADALKAAAPNAAFVATDSEDLTADEHAVKTAELMGQILCKQEEANALVTEFHEAVERAKAAYDPEMTVMGLVTSGNEIRYANPQDGRGASIFFSLLNLTPALAQDGSSNHQGDDISIEAIAEAAPDFFLVLDRDAAFAGEQEVTPALELINGSAALASVPAVENQAIYIMPADYYLTEDIYAYITVLDGLTQAFEAQK